MRTAFIEELIAQARQHQEIFLVVGDLGFSVVEPFANEFPDRYLNAGVAEQNMTGVAAGLASEGYHVFTYSIANFPTLRCLEQIRNDICYHRLPVTVVAVGAGMAYGSLGYSHHAIQDIAIMSALPELTLLSPADPGETRECVQWLAAHPQPSYLRIGKAGEQDLHTVSGVHRGLLHVVESASDAALVATGSILSVALQANALLKSTRQHGLNVYSLPKLHPLDASLPDELSKYRKLFILEEHLETGGVASLLRARMPTHGGIVSFHLPTSCVGAVGSQEDLRRRSGLSAEALSARIQAVWADE